MSEIIMRETNWEEVEELRDHEPNSYSLKQAYESYKESKE